MKIKQRDRTFSENFYLVRVLIDTILQHLIIHTEKLTLQSSEQSSQSFPLGSLASSHPLEDINQVPDQPGKIKPKAKQYQFVLAALRMLNSLGIKSNVLLGTAASDIRRQQCLLHTARNQALERRKKHPNNHFFPLSLEATIYICKLRAISEYNGVSLHCTISSIQHSCELHIIQLSDCVCMLEIKD